MPPLDSLPSLPLSPDAGLDPFSNPQFWKWLLGQSLAFITVVLCLGMWIRSLFAQIRSLFALLQSERQKNDELSSSLLQHTERALMQRAKDIDDFALRQDSSLRNLLEFFRGLAERPQITEHSIAQKLPTKLSEHRDRKARKKQESDDERTPVG